MKKFLVLCLSALLLLAVCAGFSACSAKDISQPPSNAMMNSAMVEDNAIMQKNSNTYTFNDSEYQAVNTFLSRFTLTGYLRTLPFDLSASNSASMLQLARLDSIRNLPKLIEQGSYRIFGADRRMRAEALEAVVFELFKTRITSHSTQGLPYADGYYYWSSSETEASPGFLALTSNIETMGDNQYSVTFNLYNTRSEESVTLDNKYYGYTMDDALREFPRGSISGLNAIIKTSDLSDASEMQLIYMQKNTFHSSKTP